MKPWVQLCQRCSQFCVHCVVSFCCWTLWLVLTLTLAFQLYIVLAHELPVPGFLLRSLESRLDDSGVKANFGRTTFDPTGSVLVEDLRVSIGSFEEPVATARQVYVELDPWELLAGRFAARHFRAYGVNLQVPAMLSDSGRGEVLLQNMDAVATLRERAIEVHQLKAQLAGLSITAKGVIDLHALPKADADTLPLTARLSAEYPLLCRHLTELSRQLAGVTAPHLNLQFHPSEKLGAIIEASLDGTGFTDNTRSDYVCGPFQLSTRLPLWSQTPFFARVAARIENISHPTFGSATNLRTILRARVTTDTFQVEPQRAEIEISRLETSGTTLGNISAAIWLGKLPQVQGDVLLQVGAEKVRLSGTADLTARNASVHAVGRFDPALLIPIGKILGRDIRPFINFGASPAFDLNVNFNPGGVFAGVEGTVSATDVYAYRVTFDRIGGHISFNGHDFVATNAAATIGPNFARGSYTQNLASKEFRFLLNGQLRPPDISGWFREWWPNFWTNFDFGAAAPDASVDVQGQWGQGYNTSVFVYADADRPVIKGVPLDHANTLIYLRPSYYDAMDIRVNRGSGSARGAFIRRLNDDDRTLERMDFAFTSNLDLAVAAGLVGPEVENIVTPFEFSQPPALRIQGYFAESGPAPRRYIEVQGTAPGNLTFHKFPLNELSFSAVMTDDNLLIEPLHVEFAGGNTSGRVQIRGEPGKERLGFDLGLKQGNLQKAAVILAEYSAAKHGEPKPKTSAYIQQTANVTVNLDVSAEGDLANPYSFNGSGNAELHGRGLGEVRLLGLLSELLNFTALRFNDLRANFTVEQDHLQFSEVSITGSNSAIKAWGSYALEPQTLDFNARIYPFQESKFILKNVMGAVLSPLSNVLEVKLTGALDNPNWAFLIGPTNFLRQLTQPLESNPIPATKAGSSMELPATSPAPPPIRSSEAAEPKNAQPTDP
jgi:hypothetical protein